MNIFLTVIAICPVLSEPALADDDPTIDAMLGTFAFSAYHGGNIRPEQIPKDDWKSFHVVDTRRLENFEKSHIPGAVNIEWREVLSRRGELPKDKPLLLYCNTGSLSAQAAFALKVTGLDNVYILTGGFDAWNTKGQFDAYSRLEQLSSP